MSYNLIEGALGGIGLFLLGMRFMFIGTASIADDRIKDFLLKFTSNRFFSLAFGILFTFTVNSGSAALIILISLLNGGVLNNFQFISVVSGVLIGSSLLLYLHIIPYSLISGPLVLCGVFLKFFAKKRRNASCGDMILGVGILFLGLNMLEGSYHPIDNHPLYDFIDVFFYRNISLAAIVGAILTLLVQSGQTFLHIISSLQQNRSIRPEILFSMISSGGIGIMMVGLLASIVGKPSTRRVTLLSFMAVLLPTIIILIFADSSSSTVIKLATAITPHDPQLVLTIMYSIPCIAASFILTSCVGPASRMLVMFDLRRGGLSIGTVQSCAGYLDKRILDTPALALEQSRKEMVRMMGVACNMYADVCSLLKDFDVRRVDTIRQHEQVLDSLNHEINSYLASLTRINADSAQHSEISQYMNIISAIEHIGDVCEGILDCLLKKKEARVIFSDDAMKELFFLTQSVSDVIYSTESCLMNCQVPELQMIITGKNDVRSSFELDKQSHFERITSGICDPRSALIYNEITTYLARIAELSWHITDIQIRVLE